MLREEREKWTRIISEWYYRDHRRGSGIQPKRWDDDLKEIAGSEWLHIAKSRNK